MTPRRELGLVVTAAALGAAILLFAASRVWLVEVVLRPAPLPSVTSTRTGGSLVPLIPALGLVSLAGAGGLLAARGRARMVVAVLLLICGLAGAALHVAALGRVGVAAGWVWVGLVGTVVVAAAGATALWRGSAWPTMGARYERARVERGGNERGPHEPAGVPTDGASAAKGGTTDAEFWDALDRGEDPTKG